ncbi:MAG: hypothetical protein U0232_21215 [Thermomicrobiales bacterium]
MRPNDDRNRRGGRRRVMPIAPPTLLLVLGCCALGLMVIGVAVGGTTGADLVALGQGAILALAAVFVYLLVMVRLHGGGSK